MAINNELLAKVRDRILEEPRRYDQTVTIDKVSTDVAPCGTQACILGWVVKLGSPRWRCDCGYSNCYVAADTKAAELLGLSEKEAEAIYSADASGWPSRFRKQLREAKTPRGRARAAANFINSIIKHGKVTE